MNNAMAILFASGNESKLNELTIHRTTASLPFGGRYRLIDFALSNLVNSNITKIGIVTRNNYSSLMDHIRMGRDWDLNRKNSGLAIFPPFGMNTSKDVYKGKIDALYSISSFMENAKEEYVIIANSNIASNIDFDKVYEAHIKSGKTITILSHMAVTTTSRRIVMSIDDKSTVNDIYLSETNGTEKKLISLNIYMMKKSYLLEALEYAYSRGYTDFEKDILFKLADKRELNAYVLTSFSAIIDDVKTYYNTSMELLKEDIRNDVFGQPDNRIYTKVKDSVPTIYRENGVVKNSLIADGCIINGYVENSILFRNVVIESGAVVKNSIVMENGKICSNASVAYTITDKNVKINEGKNISGFATYPIVIVKNKTV